MREQLDDIFVAEQEAERIIKEAQKEAAAIKAEADNQANQLVAEARSGAQQVIREKVHAAHKQAHREKSRLLEQAKQSLKAEEKRIAKISYQAVQQIVALITETNA
ncbi:MAG: hypothetical protein GF398_06930 [Chitinivibrionales bacterium]|nr:hypothetical protein [Chitinivibrionales bacterium]